MPAHELMEWLRTSRWHYAIRIPCDVLLHGAKRYPRPVGSLYPPLGEACLYRQVGLWLDGTHRCNLVLATVRGAESPWAVITTGAPRSADLVAICFEVSRAKNYSWTANPGHLRSEDSRLRSSESLERLYLVAAVALLYATTQGMAVQIAGLRQHVDPKKATRHQRFSKSVYAGDGGVLHKGRTLLTPSPLLPNDPQPCFASYQAEAAFYDQFWFSCIRSLSCKACSLRLASRCVRQSDLGVTKAQIVPM